MAALLTPAEARPNPGRDYAYLREQGATHDQAIVGVAQKYNQPQHRIEEIAARDSWRMRYENVQALAVLDDKAFDQAVRVKELLNRWKECKDVLEMAYLAAQSRTATDKDVAKWRSALLSWCEMWDRLVAAEAEVRQKVLESRLTESARLRFYELKDDLLAAYGDNGPQYRLLVELVADAKVRLEETRSSGRNVGTSEYAELVKLVVSGIGQLQRYTEATKVEAINRQVNQAVLMVIEIAEHVLIDHPRLFQDFAHTVDERLLAAGDSS